METFITPFATALDANGVSYAEISPIGGMAVNSNWANPMTNVYEYYSDANGVLNPLFANHQDNAAAAFAAFQDALADPVNADAIVKPDKIDGWPAFAISQLGYYQKTYSPERIVIYQADQLPCDWLVNGCPPPA